jgi:hypothetical protein
VAKQPNGMNEKVRNRLRRLFAMMGSSNATERETASQKINELLTQYRKTWNDLTELLSSGGDTASSWQPAWDDTHSDEQHAGDAINAGLPAAALNKEPPDVLTLVHHVVQKYIDMKPHERIATALWILHTHIFERFTISPRLAFTSPVRGCGKTTALAVLEKLTCRPERMDNATPAAVYRLIDQLNGSTLLVDEADNLGLNVNGILRAAFNSGHRQGGSIRRVIKNEVKKFSTFAPMAIAAIGTLPLPLMQRSIIIHMQKTAGANIERFDDKNPTTTGRINIVYGFVTRWAHSKTALKALDLNPDLPRELRNRIADNWRTLISIADCFGPTWARLARETAETFARSHHDEDAGVILLADIRTIFNQTGVDRITSVDLIVALHEIEESGWSEYRGVSDDQQPRKLSAGEMARLLKPFGIRPKSVWPMAVKRRKGSSSRKGYYRWQFEQVWARYCEPAGTPAQGSKIAYIGSR